MKTCEHCAFCKQTYIRAGYGLRAFDSFFCTVKNDFTKPSDSCEHRREKSTKYDFSLSRFQKAEEDVSAIRRNPKNDPPVNGRIT